MASNEKTYDSYEFYGWLIIAVITTAIFMGGILPNIMEPAPAANKKFLYRKGTVIYFQQDGDIVFGSILHLVRDANDSTCMYYVKGLRRLGQRRGTNNDRSYYFVSQSAVLAEEKYPVRLWDDPCDAS